MYFYFKRKLTAILSADVKSYSRLMRLDSHPYLTSFKSLVSFFLRTYDIKSVGIETAIEFKNTQFGAFVFSDFHNLISFYPIRCAA